MHPDSPHSRQQMLYAKHWMMLWSLTKQVYHENALHALGSLQLLLWHMGHIQQVHLQLIPGYLLCPNWLSIALEMINSDNPCQEAITLEYSSPTILPSFVNCQHSKWGMLGEWQGFANFIWIHRISWTLLSSLSPSIEVAPLTVNHTEVNASEMNVLVSRIIINS